MAKRLNAVALNSEEENSRTENSQSWPKAGSKNRASRAGTRSVASLTPEQLARKRANDREAQRSIRLRTKTRIAYLEQRIRELSGDRDDRVIEAVCRRNLELEEELRYLRHLSDSLGRPENANTSEPMMAQAKNNNNLMYLPSITSISPVASSLPIPTEDAQSGLALWDDYQPQMAYLPQWNSRVPSNEESEVFTPYYGNGNTEELMSGYSNPTLGSHRLNQHTGANGQDDGVEPLSGHALPAPIPIPSRTVPSYNPRPDPLKSRSFPQSGSSPIAIPHLSASGPQNGPNNNLSFTSYPTDRKMIFSQSPSNGTGNNSSCVEGYGSSIMGLESNYY